MEHPFKVGDRVVCVEPNWGIKEGLEYTISKLYWGYDRGGRGPDEPLVKLSGITETGYFARRFELVTPLKQEEQIPWWENEDG